MDIIVRQKLEEKENMHHSKNQIARITERSESLPNNQ